jgi:ABC-2 type transport system ATP-binding protein
VLILDEPTAGLDPSQIRASRELIRELGKEHTILLSTHILPEVEMTCDRVIIIHRGRVVASSSLAELARQAGAETVIIVEAEGPLATEPVRQLTGVGRLESEAIPNGTRLRITTQGPRDLTPRLCDLAVQQGWKLRELRPQRQSLEEMFVRLVEGEEPAEPSRKA